LQVEIAGSYRRRKEIVHDLDLLVATKETEAVTKFFRFPSAGRIRIGTRPAKSSVRLRSGVQCDLRVVTTAEYLLALGLLHREQGTQHSRCAAVLTARLDAE